MDQDDRQIAALLEDQDMINRKFADRVAKRFDEIETTPNWLTMWRIILAIPMLLCFVVAYHHLNTTHDHAYWLWSTYSSSVLYMGHEMHNFYHKRNTILVTRWRVLFCIPMILCWSFTLTNLDLDALLWLIGMTAGALFYTWAGLCDFFDGALARYQQVAYSIVKLSEDEEYALPFSQRLNIRGKSSFGTVLDPFADKFLYFSTIFPLGWNIVDHWYLWLSLFVALILTLIRFRAIRRALEFDGKGSANRFGKYKIWIEHLAAFTLAFLPSSSFKIMSANILIGTALIFGGLSLTGHAWLGVKKATMHRKTIIAQRKSTTSSNHIVK